MSEGNAMPKVWVANYAGHSYEKAERYGEITFLTRGYVSLGNLERLFYTVVEGVKNVGPDDYLLLSGLGIVNAIACAAWMKRHGAIKLLHWDKKEKDYALLEFKADQIARIFDVLTINEAEDKWRAQTQE